MSSLIARKKISLHNIVLAMVFFVAGYTSFSYIQSINHSFVNEQDLSLFWKVYATLENKYPFEEPSKEDKIFGAIQGLVDSYGDDYSSFLPPQKSEFFNQTIHGEFGGIGAEIGVQGGYLVVIAPLKNSPAENAGILSGDLITHVDDLDISGKTLDAAISFIRGEIGTIVTLTIVRFEEEEPISIDVVREIVHIPIIDTEIIDDTFIIHLYNFNESSEKDFKEALIEFKKSKKKELLIDVRNNPGGFLTSAVDMASYFLPQGAIVLREQNGTEEEDESLFRSTGKDLLEGYDFKTVVLINNGSASAAEILAGALRDHNYAKIVGERSFGKGSVQELIQLPGDTSLKVTVAKWLTPNGDQISKIGIDPDVFIKFDDGEGDIQLQNALQVFNWKD